MVNREIEAKFFVKNLDRLEKRLLKMGAFLIQPRVLEVNQRYDRPDGSMRSNGQVLRLRQDRKVYLTYKGRGKSEAGIVSREELEVAVSDMETSAKILEALGYMPSAFYEKYRRVYDLENCHIMLDELPYGDFIEIEGASLEDVKKTAALLRLDMLRAVERSYLGVYNDYCKVRNLPAGRLTFDIFQGKRPAPEELGVQPADEEGQPTGS
ncbi:MAG TPA: class IV adenylate cyclase [Anaerolineales bacterium]